MTDKTRALLATIGALLGLVTWVAVCGATVALVGATDWFQQHPLLGQAVVWMIAGLAGAGGLWGFWTLAWAFAFYSSGYRVRRLVGQDCTYEEFGDDGMLRSFVFGYEPLADTYAPPCRISVPALEEWDLATPRWAHARRDDILSRLTQWAQHGYGAAVTFVPPSRLESA